LRLTKEIADFYRQGKEKDIKGEKHRSFMAREVSCEPKKVNITHQRKDTLEEGRSSPTKNGDFKRDIRKKRSPLLGGDLRLPWKRSPRELQHLRGGDVSFCG